MVLDDDLGLPQTRRTSSPGELTDTHEGMVTTDHDLTETCWCQPEVTYTDPISGTRVISHKGES